MRRGDFTRKAHVYQGSFNHSHLSRNFRYFSRTICRIPWQCKCSKIQISRLLLVLCTFKNGSTKNAKVPSQVTMFLYRLYLFWDADFNFLNFSFLKQVYTEGRLIVEFTFDDMMRIRSWHFAVRNHRELIPRSILAMQEPGMIESLSKNITRQGLTNTTLNYLRVRFYLKSEYRIVFWKELFFQVFYF